MKQIVDRFSFFIFFYFYDPADTTVALPCRLVHWMQTDGLEPPLGRLQCGLVYHLLLSSVYFMYFWLL